ncbi:MAG: sulfatase-like hydrolase/transferase [Deltaproteobacteria bacterium]|nr:sulfatase-like hydrolase/transferase [Deltaproteobacteria bacterium]
MITAARFTENVRFALMRLTPAVLSGLAAGLVAAVLDTRQAFSDVGGWPGPLLLFLQAVARLSVAGAAIAASAGIVAGIGALAAFRIGRNRRKGASLALTVALAPGAVLVSLRLFEGGVTSQLPARPLLIGATAAILCVLAGGAAFIAIGVLERADRSPRPTPAIWITAAVVFLAALGMRWCDAHMYRRLYIYLHGVLALGTLGGLAFALRMAALRGQGGLPRARLSAVLLGTALLALATARLSLNASQVVKVAAYERTATLANVLSVFSGKRAVSEGPRPSAALRRLMYERERRLRAAAAGPWPSFPRANIVLVSVDALRADRMGVYGHGGRDLTPAMDAWSKSAVVFERAYCPAPHSSYSITSMHTSRYTHDEASLNRELKHPTLAEILGRFDYETSAFYTQGIFFTEGDKVGHYRQNRFGFKDLSQGAPRPRELTDNAIAELDRYITRGEPAFFLWAHFFNVHEPYLSTRFGTAPSDRYDGEIVEADKEAWRFIHYAENNLARDTIIVFTADHGEEFKDHGGYYHGSTLYDEQTRVPLVIKAPGAAPRRVSAPVSTIDIAPTLLRLVGIEPPADMEGQDLRPALFAGDTAHVAVPVFSSVLKRHSVVRWPWKLIAEPASGLYELYDLSKDPFERVNLYDKKRAVADELLGEINAWLDTIGRGRDDADTTLNMGRLRDKRAVPALAIVARNTGAPEAERVEALQLLGDIKDRRVVPSLKKLLDDPNVRVSTAAALALGDMGDGSGADELKEALYDDDPAVRDRAALALGRLGDRAAVGNLIEALGRDDLMVREEAIRLLGSLRDPSAVEPLIETVPEERTRYLAVLALGGIGDPRAYDTLVDVLRYDTHTDVRGYAVVALGWLGLHKAVPLLLDVLRKEPEIKWTPEALVRLGAVGSFPLFGTDVAKGAPALKRGFKDCVERPAILSGEFLGRTTCRTEGREAELAFASDAPKGAQLVLRARLLGQDKAKVGKLAILVDGTEAGSVELRSDFDGFFVRVPDGSFRDGAHRVLLRLEGTGRMEIDHLLVLADAP